MAHRNFWVDGLSGTGKSSVCEELLQRGYMAISTDRAWSDHVTRMWVESRAIAELESDEPDVLFVCGGSREPERYRPYFTKVFYLRIDEATMRERLGRRTEADWSLGGEGVALTLALHRSDETPPCAVEIDATRPLSQVVDEVLRLAGCAPEGSWRPAFPNLMPTLQQYLAEHGVGLDPSAYDPAELRRYYEQRNGGSARGVGYEMVDGIAHLRDSVQRDA